MTADGEVPELVERTCRCTHDECWGVFAEVPPGTNIFLRKMLDLRMNLMLEEHIRIEHKHKKSRWLRWLLH